MDEDPEDREYLLTIVIWGPRGTRTREYRDVLTRVAEVFDSCCFHRTYEGDPILRAEITST